MDNSTEIWTKDDLNLYLLLYASKVDLEITEEEKNLIVSKFGETAFMNMFRQIRVDNDFECIEKIKNSIKHLKLSKEDLEKSLNATKEIFEVDGKFDAIEKGVFNVLNKIFNI